MAERDIVPFGDPVLRKICAPVTDFGPSLAGLLDDLADTLYAEPGRAGLAACQIGVLQRVVVMDCGEGLVEFINPEILGADGTQAGPEGCLSLPGYSGVVERAMSVKVRTQNRQGETLLIEAHGYLTVCIQHELDHLDGVLYIDRAMGDVLVHDKTGETIDLAEVRRLSRPEV